MVGHVALITLRFILLWKYMVVHFALISWLWKCSVRHFALKSIACIFYKDIFSCFHNVLFLLGGFLFVHIWDPKRIYHPKMLGRKPSSILEKSVPFRLLKKIWETFYKFQTNVVLAARLGKPRHWLAMNGTSIV